MWCLVVFRHDFHGQYLNQVKEKLFTIDILCLKRRSCLLSRPLARNSLPPSVWFPFRGERGNTFLRCTRLQSLLVAFRNTKNTYAGRNKRYQIDDKARFFWKQNIMAPTEWSATYAFGV